MTTPAPEDPQPRDIALEMATSEQSAELESTSEPEEDRPASPS